MSAAAPMLTAAQLGELLADTDMRALIVDAIAAKVAPIASRQVQDIFTTEEAAEYLRCSPAQLEALRTAGGGPEYSQPIKKGRVFYRRIELNAWIADSLRKHTAEDA